MITASKVHAARRCGYAFRPDVPKTPRKPGKAAVMGTAAHESLEYMINVRIAAAACEPPQGCDAEYRHAWQAYKWVYEYGLPTHVELGFLYNTETDTAALGPRPGEPGYDVTPEHCIRGTFDMVWDLKGTGTVIDYKTGKVENAHVDQLKIQAVAASRIWGFKGVAIGFLFSRLTKVIEPKFEYMNEDDLDSEAGGLRKLLKVIPTAEPTHGDHCRWCEVTQGSCPIWANAAFEQQQQGDDNGTV